MGGKRHLSAEEKALLDHALKDVQPLNRPPPPRAAQEAPDMPDPPPARKKKAPKPPPSPKQRVSERPKPAPAPQALDQRTRRQLVRGRREIDAILDLHGLRQDEAHARLTYFIAAASLRGARSVLVITGKGNSRQSGETAGVLRANVPRWLAEPSMRSLVWAVEEAGPRHGGGGALYVMIRRRKD